MSEESQKGKKRVTKMVTSVIVIFAFSWAPIQIVLLLKSLDKYDSTPLSISIQILAQVLAYANSCVNPFIYAFLSDSFRKGMRKVLSCSSKPTQHTERILNGSRKERKCLQVHKQHNKEEGETCQTML